MTASAPFQNPFRPGAGHPPPFLAGRAAETEEFEKLLAQSPILENLVLTGLRGVGKTVLLDAFKPLAMREQWAWVGTDLSEAATLSEERIVLRLLADLSVHTAALPIASQSVKPIGFGQATKQVNVHLDYAALDLIYKQTPGLPSDKLKQAVTIAAGAIARSGLEGIVFAYDEAQNLTDHAAKEQFPLSLLLDVFQSLQKQGLPVMLLLTGQPTLFPKLVEARTFADRMFHLIFIDRLDHEQSRAAIEEPLADSDCPVRMDGASIEAIVELSGGYPYFLQFISREVFDVFLQGQTTVPVSELTRKLDTDFFCRTLGTGNGPSARATHRGVTPRPRRSRVHGSGDS